MPMEPVSIEPIPEPKSEPTEEPKALETVQAKSPPLPIKRGRPPAAPDLTKSTITLHLANIVFLDRMCANIRESTRVIIDRGCILRALVTSLQDCKLDLSSCSTEEQLVEVISKRMRGER